MTDSYHNPDELAQGIHPYFYSEDYRKQVQEYDTFMKQHKFTDIERALAHAEMRVAMMKKLAREQHVTQYGSDNHE